MQRTGITLDDTTSPSFISTFWALSAFMLNDGFVSGVNTLDFIVCNKSGTGSATSNPTGLRVELSGTGNLVPEPSAYVLLGTALIAIGGFYWKRRRLCGAVDGPK